MLIAMAGLPATGKSTIAAQLAKTLNGVILSKDAVRPVLFPPPLLDYSLAQDDICLEAIFKAAAYVLRASPSRVIILDGRTFLRAYQVKDLLDLASALNQPLAIIECVCDDGIAKERLERDQALGQHPAANRTYALYQEVKTRGEPIRVPHLVVDTGRADLEVSVARCVEYLRGER